MGVLKVWLGVALALAEFAVLPHSEGACVYQGSLLADATIWKPDSCQNCRCHGDIVICKPAVCRNPHCAFEKVSAGPKTLDLTVLALRPSPEGPQ